MCGGGGEGGGEGGVSRSGDRIFFGVGQEQEAKIGLYLIFGGPRQEKMFRFCPPFCHVFCRNHFAYNYAPPTCSNF